MSRKNWSQSQLAICARLNQSYVNKIINGKLYSPQIDTLVCIALALQLTLNESKDLLARMERAFSPAVPAHAVFQEIIQIYAQKELLTEVDVNLLNEADEYVQQRDAYLPNVNEY